MVEAPDSSWKGLEQMYLQWLRQFYMTLQWEATMLFLLISKDFFEKSFKFLRTASHLPSFSTHHASCRQLDSDQRIVTKCRPICIVTFAQRPRSPDIGPPTPTRGSRRQPLRRNWTVKTKVQWYFSLILSPEAQLTWCCVFWAGTNVFGFLVAPSWTQGLAERRGVQTRTTPATTDNGSGWQGPTVILMAPAVTTANR